MFNEKDFAFSVGVEEDAKGDDVKVGLHGLTRGQIRQLLSVQVQARRKVAGVMAPQFSTASMYESTARFGMNYKHPKGARRIPVINALTNSMGVAITVAGIGAIQYVLNRFPTLMANIRSGLQPGFTPGEISILDLCERRVFGQLLMAYGPRPIDNLYRKLDVPAFGDQIAICDIDVEWTNAEGKRHTTSFNHPRSVPVRTRIPDDPTYEEIYEGLIVSGLFKLGYEEFIASLEVTKLNNVLNVAHIMDWQTRAHFGKEWLQYPCTTKCNIAPGVTSWQKTVDEPVDMRCGYKLINEDLGLTEAEVNEILFKNVTRDPDLGLTPDNIIQVFRRKMRTVRIYILNDGIIASHVVPNEERKSHEVSVYLAMNQHMIRPTDAERERLLKKSEDKQLYDSGEVDEEDRRLNLPDKAMIYLAKDFEDAMAKARALYAKHQEPYVTSDMWYQKERDFIAAGKARIALLSQRQQREEKKKFKVECAKLREEVHTHVNMGVLDYSAQFCKIYVPMVSLGYYYDEMVKSGVAYGCNRKPCGLVTMIRISTNIVIYANAEYEAMKKTALDLGILTYNNETLPGLARATFEGFIKGKPWVTSTLNNEMAELLRMYPPQALNVTFETEIGNGEAVVGIDMVKAYSSKAREGDFYTAPLVAEITYYDEEANHPEGDYLFVVYTTDTLLFSGNGLYDHKLVSYGLEQGIITYTDIYRQIKMTSAPKNNKILKGYIDYVFETVKNAAHAKEIVNMTIGALKPGKKLCKPESVILSDLSEAFWYFHNMDKTMKTIAPIGAMDADKARVAYQVYGCESSVQRTSDELIRLAIVQRSRLDVYKLMKSIKARGFQIVQVKTDAVYYKTHVLKQEIPIVTSEKWPFWGSLRRETPKVWEDKIQAKPARQCLEEMKWKSSAWKEPLGKLSANVAFDHKRLLDLPRVYVAGFPGSGKTYILNKLREEYERMGLKVESCAFTHKAARLLIGGKTANKLFGIGKTGRVNEKAIRHVMEDVQVIIIDEISMIPRSIYAILSQIPDRIKLIGGGDFAQHKPIEDQPIWGYYYDSSMFRSLFGYKRVMLQMDHRSKNRVANLAFREFFKQAEESGVKAAMGLVIPHVRMSKPAEEFPMLNICYKNITRISLNTEIMAKVCKNPSKLEDRVYKPFVHEQGKRYHWEQFDAKKLGYILSRQDEHKDVLASSKRGSSKEIVDFCLKYLMGARIDDNGIGHIEVEYYRSIKGRGRWLPTGSMSLATMTRSVRHIISDEYYVDIDCVNCHPTLLKHLAALEGLKVPLIDEYVRDREKVFKQVMSDLEITKEHAKTRILAVMNGDQYENPRFMTCKWMMAFYAEMVMVGEFFKAKYIEEWKEHEKDRRLKQKWNVADAGSFVNLRLLEMEVDVTEICVDILKKHKLLGPNNKDIVKCSDGMMIIRSPKVNDALLLEMHNAILQKTGIDMKLLIKPMTPKKLPDVLPPVKIDPAWAKYMDPLHWDEFTHLDVGMPVIADETNPKFGYTNNQSFTVKSITWHMEDEPNMKEETVDEEKNEWSDKLKLLWGASDPVQMPGHSRTVGTGILLEEKDADAEGNKLFLAVTMERFRKDFRPAYCITSYKAQGDTIEGVYGIHELDEIGANGAYVCLTRATDPKNIVVFMKSQKMTSFMKYMQECEAASL